MRRLLPALLLLLPFGAAAHSQAPFMVFTAPSGADNRATNGSYHLTWLDQDGDPTVAVTVSATRDAIPPWDKTAQATLVQGTTLTAAPIPLSDKANAFDWNTPGVEPGCWQPFAALKDNDGNFLVYGAGKIIVPDGDKLPASVWITNSPTEEVGRDGVFTLRFEVVATDASKVTLKTAEGVPPTGELTTIAADLPIAAGGAKSTYAFDVRGLAQGRHSLYAEAVSSDGRVCRTYWPWPLEITTTDFEAKQQPVEPPPPATGCACDASGGTAVLPLLALASLAATKKRRRQNARRRSQIPRG